MLGKHFCVCGGVASTKSLDPLNATWLTVYPARYPNGKAFLPEAVTTTSTTFASKGQYYDDSGKLKTYTSVCTKTR